MDKLHVNYSKHKEKYSKDRFYEIKARKSGDSNDDNQRKTMFDYNIIIRTGANIDKFKVYKSAELQQDRYDSHTI